MKAKGLYDGLKAGSYIKNSRTVNGVVRDDDKHITPTINTEGDVVDELRKLLH